MFELLLWLGGIYLVFRFFNMIERVRTPRQAPPPPPKRTPSNPAVPYSDIEDAKFEDITPPGPGKPPDTEPKN